LCYYLLINKGIARRASGSGAEVKEMKNAKHFNPWKFNEFLNQQAMAEEGAAAYDAADAADERKLAFKKRPENMALEIFSLNKKGEKNVLCNHKYIDEMQAFQDYLNTGNAGFLRVIIAQCKGFFIRLDIDGTLEKIDGVYIKAI
jgi:hypothetical protein